MDWILKTIEGNSRKETKELDLSRKHLGELPEAIGKLTELRRLDVSNNILTKLPDAIANLSKLRQLNISNNGLSRLPESIGELTRLRQLNMGNNEVTKLPNAIGNLTRLCQLTVSNNILRAIPDTVAKLTRLRQLSLSNNQLCTLPEVIGQLISLQQLWLEGNRLSTLPRGIGRLTGLRHLNVSHNSLATLPETLGQLSSLRLLNLSQNRLYALPETMGQLAELQHLNLAHNELSSLPEVLRGLTSLNKLFLHGNEFLDLPPAVLGPPWNNRSNNHLTAKPADILEYYFRLRGGKRPLNEAKLILVGHGEVGKTSLVNRLVHDTFNREQEKTRGIQITHWPIQLTHSKEGETVRLHIWDFGGQEILHSTHLFFLTQRSLYVLVLNGRPGHEDGDAEYWLNLITSLGPGSPVIVVLNKIKEHPFDLNRGGLRQKYPDIRAFVHTDCEDRTGIDALRSLIHEETDRLEHLRDRFPASWFAIKDHMAAMDSNYITYEQFRELCARHGETDVQAQDSLAFYLHSLGIALNYKDDPRLRDTHLLNPHWVTKGIYSILGAETLSKRNGELHTKDLEDILDPVVYPKERHSFLVELMRKFELCFSFPEMDGHYLIPELLGKEQPPEAESFSPREGLNFRYRYRVLPGGLLPRFIVRTHVLSVQERRWRTGVILSFERNEAIVKADLQEEQVYITITGPAAERRRLLAIIRSDFEHIHRSLSFRPEELVPIPDHPREFASYADLCVMEANGLHEYRTVADGEVLDFNVRKLLGMVDLKGTRRIEGTSQGRGLRLFYSYSHKDEELRNELENHLKIFERQGLIQPWYDRSIDPGSDLKDEIDDNLETADIILLLVSADFMGSDYCYGIEMKRAMELHKSHKAVIIPVIIRDVEWKSAPFAALSALPKDGRAVTLWSDRDSAWRNVAEGIKKVLRR